MLIHKNSFYSHFTFLQNIKYCTIKRHYYLTITLEISYIHLSMVSKCIRPFTTYYIKFLFNLNSKNGSNVINSLAPSFFFRHVESTGDEILLLTLNLHHFTLDGIVCEEFVDEDFLRLSKSMNSIKALPLARRVPRRVQQKQVVC